MKEFDWQQEFNPLRGKYVSAEELYREFVARMVKEGWIYSKPTEIRLTRSERAATNGHYTNCKFPFGECTCAS